MPDQSPTGDFSAAPPEKHMTLRRITQSQVHLSCRVNMRQEDNAMAEMQKGKTAAAGARLASAAARSTTGEAADISKLRADDGASPAEPAALRFSWRFPERQQL